MGIVPLSMCRDPNYDKMMLEFASKLAFLSTIPDIEEHCNNFLIALQRLGPPVSLAAKVIADQWKKNALEQLGITFNVRTI